MALTPTGPLPLDYDPAEPTSLMRTIPIEESGEPMVNFVAEPYLLVLDRPRFQYRRETWARRGLAERLAAAHAALRANGGYGLLILECWRPPFIQRRMFKAVEIQFREKFPDMPDAEFRTLVEQYSAPDDDEAPPPHTTGGAVDLWLAMPDGTAADLYSPFEWRDEACFAHDAPGLSEEARANRDRLNAALAAQGVTNYASEYWHYSYGDQGWAYRGGHPAAVYGAIEPEEWTKAVEDDVDAPLEFVDEAPAPSNDRKSQRIRSGSRIEPVNPTGSAV